ncbi:MAG: glycosyltransferase [Nanoarchaeota archaeon]|nr:glycosyltransferase [Nanoarchaeota archaeon]MCG2723872.1 glycosyltransferase [archaeon]
MKKLLIVSPYFYPEIGGLENYAYNIAKGLVKKGFNVTVLRSTKERRDKEEIIDGVRIIRQKPDFRISNTQIIINWAKIVSSVIDREKPDVVNSHLPVPYIADI